MGIAKVIAFQRKRIDFHITGILGNLLCSIKDEQFLSRTKINGKLQQVCKKSLKKKKKKEEEEEEEKKKK